MYHWWRLSYFSFFGLAGLQDSGMCAATGNDRDCRKAITLGVFVFKPVSWLAGDSRLRQSFSLRIHLVEWQSLSPICPSTIISYFQSPEASFSTSTSRSIASPIVSSLDRNKPVTTANTPDSLDCEEIRYIPPAPTFPCPHRVNHATSAQQGST